MRALVRRARERRPERMAHTAYPRPAPHEVGTHDDLFTGLEFEADAGSDQLADEDVHSVEFQLPDPAQDPYATEPDSRTHSRNPSNVPKSARISKRFSIHPSPQTLLQLQQQQQLDQQQQPQQQQQPLSPTSGTSESSLPKYEAGDMAGSVGEEPGINIDTMEVTIPDGVGSQVTILDYCDKDSQVVHYDVPKGRDSTISGSSERRMLGRKLDEAIAEQPQWSRVRWIVVNGLSWEALRPIAAHYKLHPLALEDVLDIPQRTKAEVHHDQVFCCYPMHTLHITPTPFSFLHSIARQCVIKIYQAILGVRYLCSCVASLFKFVLAFVFAWYYHLRAGSGKDAEQQQPSGNVCTVHGKVHSRVQSDCSSGTLASSKLGKQTADRASSMPLPGYSYGPSSWNDSSATLAGAGDEGDMCVPFFTKDYGTLCSNTESTPIEKMICELPARSMHEWNCGNLALHDEALQNMRIQGSANSVEIAIEQVSLFLLPNTVITIFERSAPAVLEPIEARLRSPLTLLRQSNDASVLVQAIFDASVDLVRPILREYRSQLGRLQVEGVHQPSLRHTRALHAFMTDLTMMRTLMRSLSALIDSLRMKSSRARLDSCSVSPNSHPIKPAQSRPISAKAAEYLADVADHAKAYLEDLDGMYAQSQTLNSLIFDTISIRAGDSVKMLSLVSVIFLPLTFLTGYFGMNFKSFTTLNHDVGYYWLVSTPAAAALTVFLMYPTAVSQFQEWWSWVKLQV